MKQTQAQPSAAPLVAFMRPVKGMEIGGVFIDPRHNGYLLLISLRVGSRKRKDGQGVVLPRRFWIFEPPLSYLTNEKDAWLG